MRSTRLILPGADSSSPLTAISARTDLMHADCIRTSAVRPQSAKKGRVMNRPNILWVDDHVDQILPIRTLLNEEAKRVDVTIVDSLDIIETTLHESDISALVVDLKLR